LGMPSMLFFPKFDARLCIDPIGFNHQNIRNLGCIQGSVDIDSLIYFSISLSKNST
jgi:hypothetical protein